MKQSSTAPPAAKSRKPASTKPAPRARAPAPAAAPAFSSDNDDDEEEMEAFDDRSDDSEEEEGSDDEDEAAASDSDAPPASDSDDDDPFADASGSDADDDGQVAGREVYGSSDSEEASGDEESDSDAEPEEALSFAEISEQRERMGKKAYLESLGSDARSRSGRKPVAKRDNRHAPTEMTSKRPVTRRRTVVDLPAKNRRDPRFDNLSGVFNQGLFDASYGFLKDYQQRELQELKEQLAKSRDPDQTRELTGAIQTMQNRMRAKHEADTKQKIKREWRKSELAKVKEGKTPFFLKRSEQKKLLLISKLKGKSDDQLDKIAEKKRKRDAGKDWKWMPKRRHNATAAPPAAVATAPAPLPDVDPRPPASAEPAYVAATAADQPRATRAMLVRRPNVAKSLPTLLSHGCSSSRRRIAPGKSSPSSLSGPDGNDSDSSADDDDEEVDPPSAIVAANMPQSSSEYSDSEEANAATTAAGRRASVHSDSGAVLPAPTSILSGSHSVSSPVLDTAHITSSPTGPDAPSPTPLSRDAAARKLQDWWRMRSMKAHLTKIKRRTSNSTLQRSLNGGGGHTHSRSSSGDNPLLRANQRHLTEFNADPKAAVAGMRADALRKASEAEAVDHVVEFLLRNAAAVDKVKLGEFFGLPDPFSVAVMRGYITSLDFVGHEFDQALRNLLTHFRLPGEAQKIDRILDQFGETYHAHNPGVFRDPATALVLAFSLIMLNTDAHNPAVKKKMSVVEFQRNNRGIDAGSDLPVSFLRRLYFEITCHEIRMNGDHGAKTAALIKQMIGAERIRTQFMAEFFAFKIIKRAKHERKVFLFADCLVLTKPRPGPRYQVKQILDLLTFTPAKLAADDPEAADLPYAVALRSVEGASVPGSPPTVVIPATDQAEPQPHSSSGFTWTVQDDEEVVLAFETPEERDVFVGNVFRATQAYTRELSTITEFMTQRVALTKANLEKRYSSSTAITSLLGTTGSKTPDPGGVSPSPRTMDVAAIKSAATTTGSLRAARLNLQRDAAKTAHTLQQTRSMLLQQARRRGGTGGGGSQYGSSTSLGGASGASATGESEPSPTDTIASLPQSATTSDDPHQPRAGAGSMAIRLTASGTSLASIAAGTSPSPPPVLHPADDPPPPTAHLAAPRPATAGPLPRSSSAHGYFTSLPRRLFGSMTGTARTSASRSPSRSAVSDAGSDTEDAVQAHDAGGSGTAGRGRRGSPADLVVAPPAAGPRSPMGKSPVGSVGDVGTIPRTLDVPDEEEAGDDARPRELPSSSTSETSGTGTVGRWRRRANSVKN
ncbi:hypothetical protein H9P43_000227 [Blastocladiella emersonii ATCC 22665]|nr:hypothetical protein H9P43_000227 [Blastocladiella emersonii ATCC 22665]